MSAEPDPKPPDRTRSGAILATVGIVVILGLAVFVGTVVVPLWQVHALVAHRAMDDLTWQRKAVAKLGGPERAAERVQAYLRLPRWIKADRPVAAHLLGWCGPAAVPAIVEALMDDDVEVRLRAASATCWIGPEAKKVMPALTEALDDTDFRVRWVAIEVLIEIAPEPKAFVPVFVGILKDDSDARVRSVAAWALGRIGPEAGETAPELIKAVGSTEWVVRRRAAEALGRIGPEAKAAVPTLERLLKDESEYVRRTAAEALKKIRGPESAPDAPEETP